MKRIIMAWDAANICIRVIIFLNLCHILGSLATKPSPGRREQKQKNAASSASTSEHTLEKVIRQTQRSMEDIHCDEDMLAQGEVNMETDGEYYTEEVNSVTEEDNAPAEFRIMCLGGFGLEQG